MRNFCVVLLVGMLALVSAGCEGEEAEWAAGQAEADAAETASGLTDLQDVSTQTATKVHNGLDEVTSGITEEAEVLAGLNNFSVTLRNARAALRQRVGSLANGAVSPVATPDTTLTIPADSEIVCPGDGSVQSGDPAEEKAAYGYAVANGEYGVTGAAGDFTQPTGTATMQKDAKNITIDYTGCVGVTKAGVHHQVWGASTSNFSTVQTLNWDMSGFPMTLDGTIAITGTDQGGYAFSQGSANYKLGVKIDYDLLMGFAVSMDAGENMDTGDKTETLSGTVTLYANTIICEADLSNPALIDNLPFTCQEM